MVAVAVVVVINNNNNNDNALLSIWNFIMGVQLRLVSKQANVQIAKERMITSL